MIVNENLTTYLHSLDRDNPQWLEQIRSRAVEAGVPIIRREMESFLRVLLLLVKPGRILEIGTGVGYSALFMETCLETGTITTIENYPPRIRDARMNLAGHDRISLMEADAREALASLEDPYDFIFLDGPKGQYSLMLPDLLRLMKPGSLLVADNVLQEGDLIRSRYVVPRRQRTIHNRMREFLWEVKHHPQLETSLVTIGDGVTLSVKRPKASESENT